MAILGIDLGGTSLKTALFTDEGRITQLASYPLGGRGGKEVGKMVKETIQPILAQYSIKGIGVSVPGIYRTPTKTVWAPNIPGWEDYPLFDEIKSCLPHYCHTPIQIESDRACYILGETWQGNAAGCKNAIFLSVGTGIGAGILVNGRVLMGKDGISGAVGWMAMNLPFKESIMQNTVAWNTMEQA
jgi:glucokinase